LEVAVSGGLEVPVSVSKHVRSAHVRATVVKDARARRESCAVSAPAVVARLRHCARATEKPLRRNPAHGACVCLCLWRARGCGSRASGAGRTGHPGGYAAGPRASGARRVWQRRPGGARGAGPARRALRGAAAELPDSATGARFRERRRRPSRPGGPGRRRRAQRGRARAGVGWGGGQGGGGSGGAVGADCGGPEEGLGERGLGGRCPRAPPPSGAKGPCSRRTGFDSRGPREAPACCRTVRVARDSIPGPRSGMLASKASPGRRCGRFLLRGGGRTGPGSPGAGAGEALPAEARARACGGGPRKSLRQGGGACAREPFLCRCARRRERSSTEITAPAALAAAMLGPTDRVQEP
jgi:hypothetical protein